MLSKNYHDSYMCLNEMGAAWVKKAKYQSILLPGFNFPDIQGAIDPRDICFKLDDPENRNYALNDLKDRVIEHHGPVLSLKKMAIPLPVQTMMDDS